MQLLVKAANLRLQGARAMLAGFRNPITCLLRPAIWEGGLRAAEGRWRDALAGRGLMARGVPAARVGQRMLRNPAFEAPWMHPPPPRVAPDERRAVPLDAARRSQGAAALCAYYSGDMPDGLYAPRPTDRAAQDTLLGAVDMRMSPAAVAACVGAEGAVEGADAPKKKKKKTTQL